MNVTLSTLPVAMFAGASAGLILPLALAGASIYLLLPRGDRTPPRWGVLIGIVTLALAGWLWIWPDGTAIEQFLFYCFAGISLLAAVAMVTQRNPVHAALLFALVVLSSCGLFLLQAAPFLMAATTIVYAGAIVVTFLFVIMLAQQSGLAKADQHAQEPFLATLAATILLGAVLVVINMTLDLRELGALGEQAKRAAAAGTQADLDKVLGEPDAFFGQLQDESKRVRGTSAHNQLESEIIEARGNWEQWRRDHRIEAMAAALTRIGSMATYLSAHAGLLQADPSDDSGREGLAGHPADRYTVASLGGLLFSDYLIPVEVAGMALLVATIGTIAITARREVRR
jgi:NADH:ubiquinone oxidoreductase subunit 6 (subunit J)